MSTTIEAPLEVVWNFMVDLDTMPKRDPNVIKVSWEPPLKLGSTAAVNFREMGVRTGSYKVKALEPHRKLGVEMTVMGSKISGTYSFEVLDEHRTKLSAAVEVDVRGLLRLLTPYLARSAKGDAQKEFARIKEAIESGTSSTLSKG